MQKIISKIASFVAIVAFVALPLNAQNSAKSSTKGGTMQIQMSFENTSGGRESTTITLEDNPATRDFYALLPLKLEFSDYVGKEKISPELSKRLNTSGLNGYDPKVGDLFYFSPWGNVGIFYAKQPFHNGLVRFGSIDTQTLSKIKAQKDGFVISFEKAQ